MEDDDRNKSFIRLQEYDLDDHDDVVGSKARWFNDVMEKLKVQQAYQLTSAKFTVPSKAVLSNWLENAAEIMKRQAKVMSDMTDIIELMKTEALADKDKVIRMQSDLLDHKDEQLKALQIAVQTTVHDSVQDQMKSYSDILTNSVATPAVIKPEIFKKVVKDVIREEDRSKNLMVFGLAEEDGEHLDSKVNDVLAEIGEKIPLAAVRIGKRSGTTDSTCRPVKITLSSGTAVEQILRKTSLLKQINRLKSVYISPDRTPEERTARRKLVEERNKRATEDSTCNHFIRGGKVCSEPKT